MTEKYLSVTDVAYRLGITTAAATLAGLPAPDVLVGKVRGWKPETIEAWIPTRPGKGWRRTEKKTKKTNEHSVQNGSL
ncbi:MAG: hypothetical protein LBJ43_03585 [Propionibacteriaceae bacterium]|nr:hypothetical protein [Propionibacteriaceae bacterium]